MKNAAIILIILLFSQMSHSQQNNPSYEVLWKKVQTLEQQALTKSALIVVRSLSEKAEKEKNSEQLVKALLYLSKYSLTLEEDAQLKIVNDFKEEINKSTFPIRNILESYLANLYWQYYKQNRYQFYNRTKTKNKVAPNDFRTWDLTTIFNEINIHFANSLSQPSDLQKEPLERFNEILNKEKNSETFRPTLFDLLAHTALDFYKTSENSITRPAYKFEIVDPDLLCESDRFTALQIRFQDTTSLQLKALQIYQQLLKFHLKDLSAEALADVDIERLKYVHENALFENKDAQYLEVLTNMASSFKENKVAALYTYEIAQLYNQLGSRYEPKTQETYQWKRKDALELCESVISQYPKSRGAEKCRVLKSAILSKSLYLTGESYIPANKPARLLVTYTNHNLLQLAAYKITQKELTDLNKLYPEQKQLAFIQKLDVAKQWEAGLRNVNDYQQHQTEILLPPLPSGQYIILATPKKGRGTFAFSPVQATNLALVDIKTNTYQSFQVIDRVNGTPIMGAKMTLTFQKNYDGPTLNKTWVTDKNGMVKIPLSQERWTNLDVSITYRDDTASFGKFYINREYDHEEGKKTSINSFLFTDRSIYRPGQPVYFKGIVIQTRENKSETLSGEKVSISLHDVNGQKVSDLNLTTNEFGSYTGEFVLPNTGLTGEFYMEVSSLSGIVKDRHYISVEEYKRPKFEPIFEPITETYKVNDRITVKGKALAYAGSNITDAKVSYTVRRVVLFPRWFYWRRPYFNSTPQEIDHGETRTDASGNYHILFKAIPDNTVAKENLPVFTYEVTAAVTDINGETHTATTTVRVGYHSLIANITIPNTLDKDKKDTITLTTNNLNGEFVATEGTLKIYKLKAPDRVLRNRSWKAPDYSGFTKDEFKKLFPHDAYGQEDDPKNWEEGTLVWENAFDTGKSKTIVLDNLKKWPSGKYKVTLKTKDPSGHEVKDMAITTVYSGKDPQLADHQLFEIKTDKDHYAIGDKAKVRLFSSAKDLTVTVLVEKNKKIVETHLVHLSDNYKTLTLPVTEEDLGGFAINYSFSAYNSFQSGTVITKVPYPKSELQIETVTFRDKLQPGTEETWSFKIKGPKGDQVATELLASMYDASLDAFKQHQWQFQPLDQPLYYSHFIARANQSYGINSFRSYNPNEGYGYTPQSYDSFNWFGFHFGYGDRIKFANGLMRKSASVAMEVMDMDDHKEQLDEVVTVAYGEAENKQEKEGQAQKKTGFGEVPIRKNLQETAFFLPQLHTDKEGYVSFSFTSPEALTKWKLQLLAHTKNLESAVKTMHTVTQKELMVVPNAPRFLREGDEIVISSKIANLTDKVLSGQAKLELVDALTGKSIDDDLENDDNEKNFDVAAKGNTQVSWKLKIPEGIQAIQYKVIAKAGHFSDGEQNVLPVLTNRMLVTETLPLWVRSNQTKSFVLEKLRNPTSTTLKNHKLTLETTSNPAWYAVQALPYLMEYPYECNEQTFAKFYANTLASHIVHSNPKIQNIFNQWANSDALISNLEKNQELKSILIQETPWLRDAQSETEQKKRMALLFNLNKMKNEQARALNKLKNNQMASGAWAWFKGGPENRFITQYIVAGLGHLKKLGATTNEDGDMLAKAIHYLDNEFVNEYERMKKYATDLNKDHLSQTQIHYLYMRSFFKNMKTSKKVDTIAAYYKGQAQKYWTNRSLYDKGLLALVLYRMDAVTTANKILRSLKENSITTEELGMYWKENTNSWYWYQAPIETQALLIEAFSEIHNDVQTIDNLKIWLLKNKQTNRWKTTKATTEAVYALLLQGSDWLAGTDTVEIIVGGEKIDPSKQEHAKVEAGTGYFKTSWNRSEITPKMAEVQISNKGTGVAWGGLYWQYFEDLDKITTAETPLKLQKKLFLKKNTDTGEEISEITDKTKLKVGDLVRVRIELKVDRPMEFVHMKDMRASGLEPINVLSSYKWQGGLGYYESTKDVSTNFFFDRLPKGVYVFEYDLRVNNAGNFSNGITTIQSMYAPEFSSHSKGVRVLVDNKM